MREVTPARLAGRAPAIAGRVSRRLRSSNSGCVTASRNAVKDQRSSRGKDHFDMLALPDPPPGQYSRRVPRGREGRRLRYLHGRPRATASADVGAAWARGALLRGSNRADDDRRAVHLGRWRQTGRTAWLKALIQII